jgi:site-specific recombinase XerD
MPDTKTPTLKPARHTNSLIVPLERLKVPAMLSGAKGRFRGAGSTLSAHTDLDAVHAWLRAKATTVATARSYRKEVERLLLWAILVRSRALSSLSVEDAHAFVRFLSSKPPADWVGHITSRESDAWRPFRGRLSGQSVRHAVGVVSGLFAFLTRTGYLRANPFADVRVKDRSAPPDWAEGRAFSASEWGRVLSMLPAYERKFELSAAQAARLRFVLEFLYGTGLRLSELAKAELKDLRSNSKGDHWLKVEDTKGKAGDVVVPEPAYQALLAYLRSRGVGGINRVAHAHEPLLASVQRNRTSSRLRHTQTAALCKQFFAFAATQTTKADLQSKLKHASTHWLRHTHASHMVESGVPLAHVRDNLRHSSIATTSRYVHTDKDSRADSVNAFFKTASAPRTRRRP